MAKSFASNKRALGICDRCGLTYPLRYLKSEYVNYVRRNVLVCPECWDSDHPQNKLGRIDYDDPQALKDPRVDTGVTQTRFGNSVRFEFDTDSESFSATNATISYLSSDEAIKITGDSSSDPYIVRGDGSSLPALSIDSSEYRTLLIRMRSSTEWLDWDGRFWWSRASESFDASRTVGIPYPFDTISMGDQWRDVVIDLSTNSNWSGTIESIRFDFFGEANSDIDVSFIRFEGFPQ